MNIRSIFLLIVFLLSSVSYAAVPEYIERNTLENICGYSECFPALKEQYKKNYFNKKHNKAFAISYDINESTNRYKIRAFGLYYEASNLTEAKNEALKACRKHNRNCQLLFINNSVEPDLYKQL